MKLRDLSRELHLQHGWTMPRGTAKSEDRNPLNFSREEWQQATRLGRDPAQIKEAFQDAWAISDTGGTFAHALEARGFYLARGERRGYVALDLTGEIYAVARWTSQRTKDVAARLGDPDKLPALEEVRTHLAAKGSDKLAAFAIDAREEFEEARLGLFAKKRALVTWQRDERRFLDELQAARRAQEVRLRLERFRSGLKGLWDRITGRRAAIARDNQSEAEFSAERDRLERQALVERQLQDRRSLQEILRFAKERHSAEVSSMRFQRAQPEPKQTIKRRQSRGSPSISRPRLY